MKNKTHYQSPACNIVEIHVEQGFAASGTIEGGQGGGSFGDTRTLTNDEPDF